MNLKPEIPFKMSPDKWLHFLVGAMLGIWLIPVFGLNLGFFGWLIVLFIAIAKELYYDKKLGKGEYEFLDIAFTMIIPTITLILHWIL